MRMVRAGVLLVHEVLIDDDEAVAAAEAQLLVACLSLPNPPQVPN